MVVVLIVVVMLVVVVVVVIEGVAFVAVVDDAVKQLWGCRLVVFR